MKGRLFVGGVSAALLAGGMMLATGCASVEDAPMPPGAYVPPETEAPIAVKGQTIEPQNQPANPPMTVTPVIIDNPEPVAPAPAPELKPEKKTPAPAPAPKVEKPVRKTGTTHVIQKGDSFWSIALLYGVSMDEVIALNPGMDPLKLQVGDKVNIPAPGSRKVMKRTGAKTSAKTTRTSRRGKKTVAKPLKDDGLYVVRKGDSFSRIAARFHIRAADLAAANNMTLDQTLQIGQKLVIPKPGKKIAPVKRQSKPVDTASKKPGKAAPAVKENKETVPPTAPAAPADAVPVPEVPAVPGEQTPAVPPVTTPAAPAETTAAPAAPVASPAALSAVAEDTTPTAVPVTGGYTADIDEDTTLEALAKKYGFGVAELKKLNPEIPADGKVRAGSVIKLP